MARRVDDPLRFWPVHAVLDFFVPRASGTIKADDEAVRLRAAVAFVIVLAGMFVCLTAVCLVDFENPKEFRFISVCLLLGWVGFLVFVRCGRNWVRPTWFRRICLHYIPFVFFLNSFYVSVFLLEEHTYMVSTWMTTCSVAAAFFLGFQGALTYLVLVLASHVYTYCYANKFDPRTVPEVFCGDAERYHWNYLVSSVLQITLLTAFALLYEVVIAWQLRDIRAAVSELAALNQSLDKANRSKSEFLTKFSHELRTPLNGILGIGQLLQKTTLDQDQSDYVHLLLISGYSLLQQINNILDFTRLETSTAETVRVDMNICNVVEDAIQFLSRSALDRGNQIKAVIAEEAATTLRGDKDHLWRCLVNIVGNSVKHTKDGMITVTVKSVSNELDGRMIGDDMRPSEEPISFKFEVTDTGSGIPEEHLASLFKPFLQYDRFQQGTGLGLVITKELVQANAGKMSVTSKVGLGSTFSFTYRFYKPKLADSAPANRQPIVRLFGLSGDHSAGSRPLTPVEQAIRSGNWLSDEYNALMLPRRRSTGPKPEPFVFEGVASATPAHLRQRRLHSSLPSIPSSQPTSPVAAAVHHDDVAQVVEPSVEWSTSESQFETVSESGSQGPVSSSSYPAYTPSPSDKPSRRDFMGTTPGERAPPGASSSSNSFSSYAAFNLRVASENIRLSSESEHSEESASSFERYPTIHAIHTPMNRTPPTSGSDHSAVLRTMEGPAGQPVEELPFSQRMRHSTGGGAGSPSAGASSAGSSSGASSGGSSGGLSQRSQSSLSRAYFTDAEAMAYRLGALADSKPSSGGTTPPSGGTTPQSAGSADVATPNGVFLEPCPLERGRHSPSPSPSPVQRTGAQAPTPPTPTGRKPEILLVEDNLINQKVAARMVTNAGYNCTVAENGLKALEFMETKQFDLVLMDCLMPVMDGFEATAAIRKDPRFRRMPVVALTACTGDHELQKCMQSGMNEIMNKPINFNLLVAVIRKYLDQAAAASSDHDATDPADDPDQQHAPPN